MLVSRLNDTLPSKVVVDGKHGALIVALEQVKPGVQRLLLKLQPLKM